MSSKHLTLATAATLVAALVSPALAGAIAGTATQSNTVTMPSGFVRRVAVDVEVPGAGPNVKILLIAIRKGDERIIARTIVKPGDLVSELPAAIPKVKIRRTSRTGGTGNTSITGPKNSMTPDVATYSITWSLGRKPTITAKPTPA